MLSILTDRYELIEIGEHHLLIIDEFRNIVHFLEGSNLFVSMFAKLKGILIVL